MNVNIGVSIGDAQKMPLLRSSESIILFSTKMSRLRADCEECDLLEGFETPYVVSYDF